MNILGTNLSLAFYVQLVLLLFCKPTPHGFLSPRCSLYLLINQFGRDCDRELHYGVFLAENLSIFLSKEVSSQTTTF